MKVNAKQLYQAFKDSTCVVTDSRKIKKGCIFFALKGPNHDGNDFAAKAIKKGASYAVVDNPEVVGKGNKYLLVKNSLESLQKLALQHRKKIKADVIAITGSNGKTTTKDLITAVLSTTYKTHATVGNQNNHIGVPLTILGAEKGVKKLVVEMGANHSEEIKQLCEIALPGVGIITNIGKAHLEGFGSIKGVMNAKGELFDYIEDVEGRVLLNMNDINVAKLGYFLQDAVTYGCNNWFDVYGQADSSDPYLTVSWLPKMEGEDDSPVEIKTKLVGEYNLDNVLAAIAVGHNYGVSPANIKKAIESYKPESNRSQIMKKGSNTLFLDAYNANPTSMKAALENFGATEAEKKVVILGDMMELGTHSQKEHTAIVNILKDMKLDEVILVGEEFSKVVKRKKKNWQVFEDTDALKEWHDAAKMDDTHVLIKGSRSVSLESILE